MNRREITIFLEDSVHEEQSEHARKKKKKKKERKKGGFLAPNRNLRKKISDLCSEGS